MTEWYVLLICFCPQVHRVFTKGAAGLEGTIQRDDSILSINGTSLEGKTHAEARSCLHQAKQSNQVLVVIHRDKDSVQCISDRQASATQKSLERSGGRFSISSGYTELPVIFSLAVTSVLNHSDAVWLRVLLSSEHLTLLNTNINLANSSARGVVSAISWSPAVSSSILS